MNLDEEIGGTPSGNAVVRMVGVRFPTWPLAAKTTVDDAIPLLPAKIMVDVASPMLPGAGVMSAKYQASGDRSGAPMMK